MPLDFLIREREVERLPGYPNGPRGWREIGAFGPGFPRFPMLGGLLLVDNGFRKF